jgi:hypothetical protein
MVKVISQPLACTYLFQVNDSFRIEPTIKLLTPFCLEPSTSDSKNFFNCLIQRICLNPKNNQQRKLSKKDLSN